MELKRKILFLTLFLYIKACVLIKNCEDYDVIIVGAGIAGTSAAYKLATAGKKVLVLEANNYIGGRTKTQSVPLIGGSSFNFQYGANWIHGSNLSTHPITKLASKMGDVNTIQTQDDLVLIKDQSGVDRSADVSAQFDNYRTDFDGMSETTDDTLSASDYLTNQNPSALTNKYYMYCASYDIEFQAAASITSVSAKYVQGDQKFTGTEQLVTSGYQRMAQYLAQHSNIDARTSHKVISITEENGVSTVKCSNGFEATALRVIVAVPIGVLKDSAITFSPALPSWKTDAIDNIGFGNVVKILIIPKAGFPTITNTEHYLGVVSNDISKRGYATFYLNIKGVANLQALMTFGLGPNADSVEAEAQSTLKSTIESRLKILIDPSITASDFDIIRTSWRTDPNFKGAYTYSSVSTRPIDWENMAKPVFTSKWHFCGQHTLSKYRGTVHGGYLSGIYSANEILSSVSEDNWDYKG